MRKNISSQFVSFQMNATADGTVVTTGTPTVYYTIDGGTQGTGAGTATHEGNGQWSYAPAQSETNGNHVAWTMVLTNAITQTVNTWPVAFDPTDSVRMGQTALPNAAADAAGGLVISDAGGQDFDAMNTAAVRLTAARAQVLDDWINAGRLDLLLDAIKVVTDGQAATGTGLSSIPWNAAWDAEVQSEVVDALVALHLDHLFAVDYDPASQPGVATALLNELIEDDLGVSRYTANALENAPSGTGASAAVIADAVWDEAKSGHVGVGSFGEEVQAHNTVVPDAAGTAPTAVQIRQEMDSNSTDFNIIITHLTDIKGATWTSTDSLESIRNQGDSAWATATGFSTHNAADIWSVATRLLTAGTNIVLAKGVGLTGLNDIAATEIVSAGAVVTSSGAVVTVDNLTGQTPQSADHAANIALLVSGVLKANVTGGFHIQMINTNNDPVPAEAVTMTMRLDNGVFVAATGTVSNTDANGVSYVSYTAADVNGTDAVAFKFAATGAKDTYHFFKLSA